MTRPARAYLTLCFQHIAERNTADSLDPMRTKMHEFAGIQNCAVDFTASRMVKADNFTAHGNICLGLSLGYKDSVIVRAGRQSEERENRMNGIRMPLRVRPRIDDDRLTFGRKLRYLAGQFRVKIDLNRPIGCLQDYPFWDPFWT